VDQRTVITLVDGLDHKEIETDGQTIRFAYQGIQYEIDLSEKHVKKLDNALAPFVAAAHRVDGRAARRAKAVPAKLDPKAVRKWPKPTASRSPSMAAVLRTSWTSTGRQVTSRTVHRPVRQLVSVRVLMPEPGRSLTFLGSLPSPSQGKRISCGRSATFWHRPWPELLRIQLFDSDGLAITAAPLTAPGPTDTFTS